ncbi:MAG TPA: 1,4-alpha-glucan branching protein GlgB, partial [Burkholderiaceae bacterium]
MLTDTDLRLLLNARHPDPFSVLGLHLDDAGGLWLRVLLPTGAAVMVLEAATRRVVATLPHREGDLFEARLPRRRKAFDYRLQVRWDDGHQECYADAYAFGPLLADEDLALLARGEHPRPFTQLGAHPMTLCSGGGLPVAGVRFAVWAPNARRVSVVGHFNNWDGRRHAMRRRHEAGIWEIFIPHVAEGDQYKYELVGPDDELLPLKADPFAFAAALRPDSASIVSHLPPVQTLSAERAAANKRDAPISIYEVHAASWKKPDGHFPTWDELAAQLPAYAAELGFTHLELMPISEHPFDGSWGYQTLGLYAPSSRFGPPEGFARFVAACHAQGLGLLLDWVPAHFPEDAFGIAQFDGTHLYDYADPREGFHRDWNTLIYNFGRNEVRQFLIGNALYWCERWGVDGLRADAVASMLYRDYSRPAGEWVPNVNGGNHNLEVISMLQRANERLGLDAPGAITLAEESTSFPGVSHPTSAGGLGFHYKWNMGWMNDTLRYIHEDPIHRRWHHEKMTFGLVYAFSENFVLPISHDEVVHGKGSMLGKMPGDDWQKFANLRAYYGFMWGHPGKKLLFMGQEFAQRQEWNHERSLPWQLLEDERHAGMQRLIRDLNGVYRELPALHKLDCEPAGFEWLQQEDRLQSVFAWLRRDDAGG